MKTSIFFLLSALTATSAFATNSAERDQAATVELPAVQLNVARYNESEKSIQSGLNEVRDTPAINPLTSYRFAPSMDAFNGPFVMGKSGAKTAANVNVSADKTTRTELAHNGPLIARR